jgi:hypothetical protein
MHLYSQLLGRLRQEDFFRVVVQGQAEGREGGRERRKVGDQNGWETAKAVIKGKFTALNAF